MNTSSQPQASGGGSSAGECPVNQATSSVCTVSTIGSYVTNVRGANISSWTNSSALTTVSAPIPNGFYSGSGISFTDPMLLSQNIKWGVSLFGVTGTYAGLASTASRGAGSSQITSSDETTTYAGISLPASGTYAYREVPKILLDDDGAAGTVTGVNRSIPFNWTGKTCGTAGTVEQRIADCANTLGSEATWTGSAKGHAGESTWKIVTRAGNCTFSSPSHQCQEVWQDQSTQLLWSSRISESINWCMASGSNNIAANPTAESDPNSYCDHAPYQNTAGLAISACFENGTGNFTNTDAAINNSGKGGLGLGSTPAVKWRLPTLHDYMVANVNGIRFVLPDMGASGTGAGVNVSVEWTATTSSANHANAWAFDFTTGGFTTGARNNPSFPGGANTAGARCVGH